MTDTHQVDSARPQIGRKVLTGRKVLAIAVAAFGIIIAANLTLAYSAIQSFPGIEVKNGYIASQSFERERAAQELLGWNTEATYEKGVLSVAVLDRDGAVAPLQNTVIHLGRPTTAASVLEMAPASDMAGWTATISLAPGPWRVDIVGVSPEGDRFRQHLVVEGGR